MNLPPLTVIEASAGTGKTFSLVTRLLNLIFGGTEPERIVALTFSRLAAGEIFNSFIERLARAAGDPKVAAAEAERLGRKLGVSDFAEKLRLVIAHQHLSLIGTLDSFLMRVVRMIPLELGLEGEITVMSDYQSPVERMRLVGEMLMLESDDAKEVFREAFRLAFGSVGAKGFLGSFAEFIEHWHTRYRDNDDPAAWGCPETIWGADVPADLDVTLAEIRALATPLGKFAGQRGADTFIAAVADFHGPLPNTLPKCMTGDPAFEEAVRKMRTWKVARELKATQGVYRLMRVYEGSYRVKVRQKGRMTFEDMPRLLNSLGDGVRLPLEYRMDAQFDHWALDEFQDTSRDQWKAIRNLIYENSQPDLGKSVFIVGDRKQSIYEWRGGDVRILGEQVAEAAKPGNEVTSLDESRRYVSEISEAVNAVFGEAQVRASLDMDGAPESAVWRCRRHESHDAATQGFVEVIQAEKAGNRATIADFFEPIENALQAVKPWTRGISTAILVRKNGEGEAILAHLKARGVDKVVFEGESKVSDSPVLSAMTELVKLAEHAGDEYAYAHIRLSPLGAALYPQGVPPADELSARLLDDFTKKGLVRKFREVREALKTVPGTWNAFTESRFEDFVKCVAEFESARDATMRLSDFIAYLDHKTRRDYAEPGMVRIMTMHQSKGLGFDWVIVPFYEPEKLTGNRHVGPLESEDPKWILSNPSEKVDAFDPVLSAAERRRQQIQCYNSLCLCYVAMTRAKRALTLILDPLKKESKKPAPPEKFSDLVRHAGLATSGRRDWYLDYQPSVSPAPVEPEKTPARAPRSPVAKSRPSESFYTGLRGDRLFAEDFGSAARRGVEVHARYQQIEWATEAERTRLPEGFRAAFVKPSPDATVWRERSYELFVDGKWESGQFDRVVFAGTGKGRAATIYDFKTDAVGRGESADAFAQRMRRAHGGQLTAYRKALAALTGLPLERIAAKLLLESTGESLSV